MSFEVGATPTVSIILQKDYRLNLQDGVKAVKDGDLVQFRKKLPYISPMMFGDLLACAVAFRQVEIVEELLIDPRTDPSEGNNRALKLAVQIGRLDIVKMLLDCREVDPSDNNNEALKWAQLGCDPEFKEIRSALRKDKRVAALEEKEQKALRSKFK